MMIFNKVALYEVLINNILSIDNNLRTFEYDNINNKVKLYILKCEGDIMKEKFSGLSTKEVKIRQRQFGLNEFVKVKKPNPVVKFFQVFKEPMFLLLIITSLFYIVLGEKQEAGIMFIFVIFVAFITFIQEWRTEKTIDALKELTSPKVTVFRDGHKQRINSFELVPDDVIYLMEGERIPADCLVLECSNFIVDESILTGESIHVNKTSNIHEDDDYWKSNLLYAGTLSIFGSCIAKVQFTGFNTEYGKISKEVSEAKEELTPLQRKTKTLVKNLAIAGIVMCVIVIIFSYMYSSNLIQSILSGITLAMAIIPEEFPVVLTVFLSLGAFRLARNNALMRKVSAVETLGAATVLAVDKTGTLTKNQMEVREVFKFNKIDQQQLDRVMMLSCEKEPYDAMEKAIVYKSKFNRSKFLEPILKIPFNPNTKRMANIFKENESYYVAVKGAPETILPLCNLSIEDIVSVNAEIDIMANKGLRVLALANCNSNNLTENLNDYNLQFCGLVALQDPPKEGVKEAIELCKKAGIRVVMITGDYSKTALSIGREIGLNLSSEVISGDDIDRLSYEELKNRVSSCDIFSRVIPEHKMKIVKALRANGEVVAMTGDGVNDAPALKAADIGIAMGKRGTDVAKEAAHMILMDDNFTTIVSAVRDGRRIYDNIRKAMVYIMVIHMPIILLALTAPLFNLPQLLLPVHIVLLELIIDPTCSIVFEGERAEPYIMERCPKSPNEPLLTKNLIMKVILQGLSMFLFTFIPFHILMDMGVAEEIARSFALVVLIFSNFTLVLVNRSNSKLLVGMFQEKGNKTRLLINGISIILVLLILYIPWASDIFKTYPLEINTLSMAIVLGIISSLWWDLTKVVSKLKTTKVKFK